MSIFYKDRNKVTWLKKCSMILFLVQHDETTWQDPKSLRKTKYYWLVIIERLGNTFLSLICFKFDFTRHQIKTEFMIQDHQKRNFRETRISFHLGNCNHC